MGFDSARPLLRLAEGGMAEVWVARADDGTLVVLKRIPAARDASPELYDCLREEARLAAHLRHPNVCRLLGEHEDARGVTLVMEYLEGVQLRRLASATADLALVAGLIQQTAAGLDHVHDAADGAGRPLGIVHRDVNPQNLMVTAGGVVKLLDFGIAKARDTELRTRTGSIKGTPAYLSPEQVRGQPVDRRSDVFALGSTAVKMLTGEAPFARENFFATVQAITGEASPDLRAVRPDLPPALVDVIARALERDPARRTPTAGAFARELVAALPAGVEPFDAAAIAARVDTQFGLELVDRRRRIEFAIDDLGDASASESRTQGTIRLQATPVPAAAPASIAEAQPVRRRSSAALVIAVAGVALVGAAVGIVLAGRDTAPAPPVAAAPPTPDTAPGRDPDPDPGSDPDRDPDSDPDPDPDPDPGSDPDRDRDPDPDPVSEHEHEREDEPERAKPRPRRRAAPKPAASTNPGFLTVGSTPFSTIFVDGTKLGVTPLFRKPLAPGRRKLRAVCSCGKTRELTVLIEPGQAARPVKLTW